MRRALIAVIRFYQKIGPILLASTCRFYPSCSNYTIESTQRFGLLKGSLKAIQRILRCSPFFKGGFDPVK